MATKKKVKKAIKLAARAAGTGLVRMEKGTIKDVMTWGAGTIDPDKGGERVRFTARVFQDVWGAAVPGAPVRFLRYVDSSEAKRVECLP
jgi:hypothetical protein